MTSTGFTGPAGMYLPRGIADILAARGVTGIVGPQRPLNFGQPGFLSYMNNTGPTGPPAGVLRIFPSAATGTVEDPHITSIDELTSSYGAVVAKEQVDKNSLSILISESRGNLRVPLFQWAAQGFPVGYVVQTFSLDAPPICSDGVSRSVNQYFEFCLGMTMGDLITSIQSRMSGIVLSYTFMGNTLQLKVSKA